MAILIIDAYEFNGQVTLAMDLDAKNPGAGSGDRSFVVQRDGYPVGRLSVDETEVQFLTRLKDETRTLARAEAIKRGIGVPVREPLTTLIGQDIT